MQSGRARGSPAAPASIGLRRVREASEGVCTARLHRQGGTGQEKGVAVGSRESGRGKRKRGSPDWQSLQFAGRGPLLAASRVWYRRRYRSRVLLRQGCWRPGPCWCCTVRPLIVRPYRLSRTTACLYMYMCMYVPWSMVRTLVTDSPAWDTAVHVSNLRS